MDSPIEIFFSYAHEDEALMDDVRRQLIVFERNGKIIKWHDRMIPGGAEWREEIDQRLLSASIVLLFMSPHFIESQYCYEVEGRTALRRHEENRARVIPIVLRPCAWEATPFGELHAFPKDAKAISSWPNRDEACLDAARGVMAVVDSLRAEGRVFDEAIETQGESTVFAPTTTSIEAKASGLKLTYCNRCGQAAGKRSECTGQYTHHAFIEGQVYDFCSRCGVHAGATSRCTGQYTHHEFRHGVPGASYCGRCGVAAGEQSQCTGQYNHHEFR